MSDMGDYWREHRQYKQKQNRTRRVTNTDLLKQRVRDVPGVSATARDGGTVWRLSLRGTVVDYWPSTGTARNLTTGAQRFGLSANTLLRWLKRGAPAP